MWVGKHKQQRGRAQEQYSKKKALRCLNNVILHAKINSVKHNHLLGSSLPHKPSRLLEKWTTRFEKHGNTYSANILGVSGVCTINPLNSQVMLGANFKDYGVQPMRRSATLPFLGEVVFAICSSRNISIQTQSFL